MKKILLFCIFAVIAQFTFSQVYKGKKAEALYEGAEIIRFKEHTKTPVYIRFKEDFNMDIQKSLESTKKHTKESNTGFELMDVQRNNDNESTHRYIQTINGYPVEFSAWNIHTKQDKVFAMNGEILDNPVVSGSFSISEETALQKALDYIKAEKYMWQDAGEEELIKRLKKDPSATHYPKAVKVIVPDKIKFEGSTLRPAYKLDIFAQKPYDRKMVYVDAETGNILFDLPLIHSTSVTGTAYTQYSGVQEITTEFTENKYILYDKTRGDGIYTLNCNNDINYQQATDFVDDDNIWNNVNPQLDQYATDAHFGATKTYDYLSERHNRNSIDNRGYELMSFIHFNLIEYGYGTNVNAFWNGYYLTYGDGDPEQGITPLTSIDICAHEITHGLTQKTANLTYAYESGALNEAYSDIFGAAVEFYAVPELADWEIGEDIGETMRSLKNPKNYFNPDTYKGEYWNFGSSDNGGVHTNSGPMYHWFYLLSDGGSGINDMNKSFNVSGIGIEKAERIAFRTLTHYLTNNSDYSDACFYSLQSAADLYGPCSDELKAVGDAFYAIGVLDEPYVIQTMAEFNTLINESCTVPFSVQFTNKSNNAQTYMWDFGDGETSTEANPTHIYNDYGKFDVTLSVDGSTCGSDMIKKDDYILIDENIPCSTIMPATGSVEINSCSGIIYDPGGPNNNYPDNCIAKLVIHAEGASGIILNILEYDIEPGGGTRCNKDYLNFYQGTNTINSNLINGTSYCNLVDNPGQIEATGEYLTIRFISNDNINHKGFKIQYNCIMEDVEPSTNFIADKTNTCDGAVNFTDMSFNGPESWQWDFGDGTTSNEQNPSHQYQNNGTYTVNLVTSNSFGSKEIKKINYITVEMPEMSSFTPDSIYVCPDEDFNISINFDGQAYWYNNIDDTEYVHYGNDWTHASLSENKTYYIREIFEGEEFNVGPEDNTNNGEFYGNTDNIHFLVFDAYEDFILESVLVNSRRSKVRAIALRDATGQTIRHVNVSIPEGVSRVELNMPVPAGTNMQLVGLGSPDLFMSDDSAGISYPYTADDIVSIKSCSAEGEYAYSYYYYFYDWNIKTISCKSEFSEFNIAITSCNSVDTNPLGNVSIAPNPSRGIFNVYGLEYTNDYQYTISDVSGKTIINNMNLDDNIIDLTSFAEGIYFIKISNSKEHKIIKLVNQK